MYFIFNVYGDIKNGKIMDYKGLRNLYIDELYQDTIDNCSEREIVVYNAKEFVNLAQSDTSPNVNDLKDYLASFGWKIIDLLEIQRDLEDLKNYFAPNKEPITISFDTIINTINKGVNENERS